MECYFDSRNMQDLPACGTEILRQKMRHSILWSNENLLEMIFLITQFPHKTRTGFIKTAQMSSIFFHLTCRERGGQLDRILTRGRAEQLNKNAASEVYIKCTDCPPPPQINGRSKRSVVDTSPVTQMHTASQPFDGAAC